jgi:glycine dehydrogenase subunit 1
MTFIPHSPKEREAMLAAVGLKSLAELFEDVPARHRFPHLDLPPALSEMEASAELAELAAGNENVRADLVSFLGAGAYNHYIPAVVDAILQRGEFSTAYTPYQPEVSQGTLQAIFEYQSLISALTGMEAANASHYDGATAAAEALSLAHAHFRGRRRKAVVSPAVHPQVRAVLQTYASGLDLQLEDPETASLAALKPDPATLIDLVDENTALLLVQYPDFLGRVYDYSSLIGAAHARGALVCVIANPTALGLLKTPGAMGADIVVGEGQPLGIPLAFGGPYLGFFATRRQYVHKTAGRLVGETVDNRGQRAYVLTLTAREQHIRRERATSNICTNQGLLALASAVYLALLGPTGLRKVAELCYHKAHYAAERLGSLAGFSLAFDEPFFHEFALRCPRPVAEINDRLLEHGILGGFDLGQDYAVLQGHMLIAVTEMNTRDEIDALAGLLEEVSRA